jgi:hypothetical protein
MSLIDQDPEGNRKIFGESAAAVRNHVGTAMGEPALVWISENVTAMVNGLTFHTGRDKSKINQLAKLAKNLLTGGWTNSLWGGVTVWKFVRGEVALGPAKLEKAIKPVQSLATVFFALAEAIAAKDAEDAAADLGGGDEGEDDFLDETPLRGGRENDELPFEHFMDGSTEVPGFVKDVTNRFLHAEPGLGQRATDFGRANLQSIAWLQVVWTVSDLVSTVEPMTSRRLGCFR